MIGEAKEVVEDMKEGNAKGLSRLSENEKGTSLRCVVNFPCFFVISSAFLYCLESCDAQLLSCFHASRRPLRKPIFLISSYA